MTRIFDPVAEIGPAIDAARHAVTLLESDHIASIHAESAAMDAVDSSWGPDKVRAHEALLAASIMRHEACNAVRAAEDEVLRLERWHRIIYAVSVPLYRNVTVSSVGRPS